MIGNFLLLLVGIISSGVVAMLWAKYISVQSDIEMFWWTKCSLLKLIAKGVVATVLFLSITGFILSTLADSSFKNDTTLSLILKNMQYEFPSNEKTLDRINTVKKWFTMENENISEEAKYAKKDFNKNFIGLRDRFLQTYISDIGDSKLLDINPFQLLEYVITEEKIPKACNSASDTFLIMWFTMMDRQEKHLKKLKEFEKLVTEKNCIDILKAVDTEDYNTSIQYKNLVPMIYENIKEQFVLNINDFFTGALKGDIAMKSSKAILSALPTRIKNDNTAYSNVFATKVKKEERLILMAQLDVIRDNLESIYRIAVVIFGPIQFILLTLFFSACFALGERMKLTIKQGKLLIELFEKRLKSSTLHDINNVKEVFDNELDEEASFPISFIIYVLPLIGFTGTIIGLAGALGSAVAVLKASVLGISEQVEAFNWFMAPLGIAFDTTLIALVTTPFIYFVYSYIRTYEREIIKSYCEIQK